MEQRVLGDYNLLKQIGQGSMGTVFLAEHRFMKKQFALKILPEELSSDRGFIQRFEEEVGLLASLDHPNIVKVHTVSFAQGAYFLVTECTVDSSGETTNLAQYLAARGDDLSEDEIYEILAQVASALDYAHTKKSGKGELIHCGLKLNNILVAKPDANHKIKVMLSDFGIYKIVGVSHVLARIMNNVVESLSGAMASSAESLVQGSPANLQKTNNFLQAFAFLSPEQKSGDKNSFIDGRSDVYAFGVLAYLLTMQELPHGFFPLPSEKGLTKYNFDHLIESCMQSNLEKRPSKILPLLELVSAGFKAKAAFNSQLVSKLEVKASPEIEKRAFAEVATFTAVEKAQVAAVTHPGMDVAKAAPVLKQSKLERPEVDLDPGAVFQQSTAVVKNYQPEPKDTANVQPILTEMVVIQGGEYQRGSNDGNRDEMPRHPVFINSFAIDVHPVTNEQFVRFLEVMGGEKDTNHNDIIRLRDSRIKRSGGKLSIESGYSKHPVVGVTWYGAVAYSKWIGKRLPTEAEWEIAAKSENENALFPTGNEIEKNQANFFSSDTTAVMSYAPTDKQLYDMAGNVYEWCQDWYGYNYYETSAQEPDNPKGPLQGIYRVLRGGCWKSLKEDLRCSRRHRNNPGTVNSTYGFRCVTDVEQT